MKKYFGAFESREQMAAEFDELSSGKRWDDKTPKVVKEDFPKEEEILLAGYFLGNYEGSAYVLFEKDGKLFEVETGHCSCYGLEEGWNPGETTWKQLVSRKLSDYIYPQEFIDRLKELIDAHRN